MCGPQSRHMFDKELAVYRLPPHLSFVQKNPSYLKRIHCFGVGDVQEVRALRLEFGVRGHLKVDTLHLNQAPFFQQQILHHLKEEEGYMRLLEMASVSAI